MGRRKIRRLMGGCIGIMVALFMCASAYAVPLTVRLDVSQPGGATTGTMILDFIDGDGLAGSTAFVYGLSSAPSNLSGAVSEVSAGRYSFSDDQLLSSLYFEIPNVYSSFSFTVDANMADPGNLGFPDALVVSLLGENGSPLFPTADPRGTDSLLVLSAYGTELYAPAGFTLTVTNGANPVPEPASLLLLAVGAMVLFFLRRKPSKRLALVTLFAGSLSLAGTAAQAALMDVTSQVSIQRAPLVYNRTTSTYDGLISVRNNGTAPLKSPMFLVVSGLPVSVSVNNATSLSVDGFPMLNLPVTTTGLATGQSISNFKIKFHNPGNLKFTAVFRVLSDSGGLPPDPAEAGKATLAGVDSNNNGIRDDVEIYIAANFDGSEKKKEGLNQYAVTVQKGLQATSDQESMQAANVSSRALECLEYIAPSDNSWKSVKAVSLNTPDRIQAWKAHQKRLSGKVFPLLPKKQWKNSCSFNPDALAN